MLLVVALLLQACRHGAPPRPPLASDWLARLSICLTPAEIHVKHRLRMTPNQLATDQCFSHPQPSLITCFCSVLITPAAEIHMKYKLRMTPDQVIDNAVTAVKHLRSLGCNDIEFTPEDAGR